MNNLAFFSIPLILLIASFISQKFNGRRRVFRIDLIQVINAFVFVPAFYVWGKFFILRLFQTYLLSDFSMMAYFAVDTIFSIFSLILFGFIVIHALTKTFQLEKAKQQTYDMFKHSEYFHLWLTHLVFFWRATTVFMVDSFYKLFISFAAGNSACCTVWITFSKHDVWFILLFRSGDS